MPGSAALRFKGLARRASARFGLMKLAGWKVERPGADRRCAGCIARSMARTTVRFAKER